MLLVLFVLQSPSWHRFGRAAFFSPLICAMLASDLPWGTLTAGVRRWVQQEWDISHGGRRICSWWVTFISLQKWADGEAAQGVHFEGGVRLEMHLRKIRLARCLKDEGSREKLLCRLTASVGGTFAEKTAVGPVVLEFALISGEHFSRSHTEIALLWLPEISLPYEHSLWYLPCAGRKILPP